MKKAVYSLSCILVAVYTKFILLSYQVASTSLHIFSDRSTILDLPIKFRARLTGYEGQPCLKYIFTFRDNSSTLVQTRNETSAEKEVLVSFTYTSQVYHASTTVIYLKMRCQVYCVLPNQTPLLLAKSSKKFSLVIDPPSTSASNGAPLLVSQYGRSIKRSKSGKGFVFSGAQTVIRFVKPSNLSECSSGRKLEWSINDIKKGLDSDTLIFNFEIPAIYSIKLRLDGCNDTKITFDTDIVSSDVLPIEKIYYPEKFYFDSNQQDVNRLTVNWTGGGPFIFCWNVSNVKIITSESFISWSENSCIQQLMDNFYVFTNETFLQRNGVARLFINVANILSHKSALINLDFSFKTEKYVSSSSLHNSSTFVAITVICSVFGLVIVIIFYTIYRLRFKLNYSSFATVSKSKTTVSSNIINRTYENDIVTLSRLDSDTDSNQSYSDPVETK